MAAKKAALSWEGEVPMDKEIEIPAQLAEPLLLYAAETELSAEEIVEMAFRKFIKGDEHHA